MKKPIILETKMMPLPIQIKLDTPISARENLKLFFTHKKPAWIPNIILDTEMLISPVIAEIPLHMDRDGEDWFGVHYKFSEEVGSPMPVPPHKFYDVCDWKKYVEFPDLNKIDFSKGVDEWKAKKDPNKMNWFMLAQGCFERLHSFIGFENALVSLLLEPEACSEFFAAVADFKIQLIKKLCHAYGTIDIIAYTDDWGTQKDTFFSPQIMKDLLYEPTKRIADTIKECGSLFQFHCCGKVDRFIPDMIELGTDVLEIQMINNMAEIRQFYGDKCTSIVVPDPYIINDPDVTDKQLIDEIHYMVDTYGAGAGVGSGFMTRIKCASAYVYEKAARETYEYSKKQYSSLKQDK